MKKLVKHLGSLLTWEQFPHASHVLIVLYCLSSGISIAASQIFLAPVVLLCIATACLRGVPSTIGNVSEKVWRIESAICLWLVIAAVSAFVGISPSRSLPELLKTILYLQLPFIIFLSFFLRGELYEEKIKRMFGYLLAIVLSLGVAAIHTAISTGIADELLPRTPGPLTESGQLVLVIPAALALLLSARDSEKKFQSFFGISSFLLFLLFSWPGSISSYLVKASLIVQILSSVLMFGLLGFAIKEYRRERPSTLYSVLLGLLLGALVVNLKRGPWFGVGIELLTIGWFLSKRLLIIAAAGSSLLLALEPARQRLLSLIEHFMIPGGRLEMWTLGSEMAARFPLGLGFDNAEYMRQLDPSIPETHRHMHSNILNIVVETGWIGLAAYLWWMFLIISLAISIWRSESTSNTNGASSDSTRGAKLCLCLGMAILGWQVSGLAEYNFGDGEIQMLGLFSMGMILALTKDAKQ